MKALLIIVLLIGAAFGIPQIRNRIAGPLDPLLSRLGPIGEAVQTPTRRWQANQEMTFILRRITEDRNLRKPLPSPHNFQRWLIANVRGVKNGGNDPWGQPYYYILTRTTMTIGSQGQDMQRDTEDDLRLSAPATR